MLLRRTGGAEEMVVVLGENAWPTPDHHANRIRPQKRVPLWMAIVRYDEDEVVALQQIVASWQTSYVLQGNTEILFIQLV